MSTKGLAKHVAADVDTLAKSLAKHGVKGCDLAFVLGSGLGVLADRIEKARSIPYGEIEAMPPSSVPGHAGRLVVGEIAGVRVVAQQGRVHLYEGWSVDVVTRCIRALAQVGVKSVVLTNAAGGIRAEWKPGTLMRITDHVNLQGRTPLAFDEANFGSPYDAKLGAALVEAARAARIELVHGVYAGLLGPTYETPAEVRMLAWLGADAVGMSTVAEALAARASGMKVAGVSCITNQAAGISVRPLSHEEVIEVGKQAAERFCDLLMRSVPLIVASTGT
jgi:purine-nucleoside phosphorylase